jgi:hypothetical protein
MPPSSVELKSPSRACLEALNATYRTPTLGALQRSVLFRFGPNEGFKSLFAINASQIETIILLTDSRSSFTVAHAKYRN